MEVNEFNKLKSKVYQGFNVYYKYVILLIMAISTYYLYRKTADVTIIYLLLSTYILIFLLLLLKEKATHNEIQNMLVELSDLLDNLINKENLDYFDVESDTITGKLQFQVNKLSNILTIRNKALEKEKNEVKSFVSDIAHQLKTPMANLKLYNEILKDETLTKEERSEFNDIILETLSKLDFLTESLIKISRLESGIIGLKLSNYSLNEIVLIAIAQVQKNAISKKIEINYRSEISKDIVLDKNWTIEAIVNILDNAIKYSPTGSIIEVKMQYYDIFTRVDIIDRGIGIGTDELALVFNRFYRGENATNVEGLGLGLYLSNKILNMQHGYIKITNKEIGTCVSLFFHNK